MTSLQSNKKGIELSINFIVMVLFSIVALSLGIALVTRMFSGAVGISEQLSERDEAALADLLAQGERVAVPFSSKEAHRGDVVIFGLGILNIGDQASPVDFCAKVAQAEFGANKPKPVKPEYRRSLRGGDGARIPVAIEVPKETPNGNYAVNIDVCKLASSKDPCSCIEPYGSAQLFVRVK